MIGAILRFELRQRLFRVSTCVYIAVFFGLAFLFALATGDAVPGATVDFGAGGKVLVNSPYALNIIISYSCIFGMVVTAALSGQATYQDTDHNCAPFFYTAPISKLQYLIGRFLGSLAVQLLIFSSVGLGAWAAVHTPWMDPARLGPERILAYLQPYLVLVLPNLVFTSALFFALAAFARKMLPVYAGSITLLIFYFLASQFSTAGNLSATTALADPFGRFAADLLTHYWTPFDRNTRFVELSGILLANRILWLGIAFAIFAFTVARFSFSHTARLGPPRAETPALEAIHVSTVVLPRRESSAFAGTNIHQALSLTKLQFVETVKNIYFAVLALAGWIFAVLAAVGATQPAMSPLYPVTHLVLDLAGGGFMIFALAITTFVAGELVWRERDARIHQIMDALPVQRWVLFTSKLGALMLVQVLLVILVLLAGLTVQMSKGYYRFEFGLYFRYLFGVRLIQFWILCVLALFVHTLVNQKYLGHFVMVLYYIAMIALPALGFEHYLYRIGQIPEFTYSDMNGFGPYAGPILFFLLYWGCAAVPGGIITSMLWVRGVETGWRGRLTLATQNLSTATRAALVAGVLLIMAIGGYIFYNTNARNSYRTAFQVDEERALYEKKYRQYFVLPQPRVAAMNLRIDLTPEQRVATVSGTMRLENRTDQEIDRVAVTIWPGDLHPLARPHIEIRKLSFTGGQTLDIEDPDLGFSLYRLRSSIPPGSSADLEFSVVYSNPGFVNSRPNTDIAANGTFLNNTYAPFVGYNPQIELDDDSTRRRHGLQTVKRLPALEDAEARKNSSVSTNADWIRYEATVSTSADQVALMPGYLEKEWTQNGRRYFHYKMDTPILPLVSLNSARYAVRGDQWRDVHLEIYYHPGHEFDLERMMRGMKATLDYCDSAFSPYQFRQLRIVEFPGYGTFAESFANTIPYSESIGFITYVDPKNPDALDLPFYVTAHETGHQWWAHQVMSANTEGATAIVETLAQYTAFMVMKRTYGAENMQKFLRYEMDRYLRGRARERNEEKPLYRVEPEQGYIHYNKGGLVMYALQDYVGEKAVNRALADFIRDYGLKGPPYPTSLDLIAYLKKVTPPKFQYLYEDLFENITIFENRAVSAISSRMPDGKYSVHLVIDAAKFRADGRGQEHPAPLHDYMDIGILDENGNFLHLQKQRIDRENIELQLIVDKPPAKAGIDPLLKLIDRNPDNNLVKVKPG